ncbi:MAG: hypothetical protein D6781_05345 [Verrucomicrobia bacterium]|nr:MAG: hypothetical protein D6781_05345 [Verrucomicrobiota bacterium]
MQALFVEKGFQIGVEFGAGFEIRGDAMAYHRAFGVGVMCIPEGRWRFLLPGQKRLDGVGSLFGDRLPEYLRAHVAMVLFSPLPEFPAIWRPRRAASVERIR